jgi:hypothetical protein
MTMEIPKKFKDEIWEYCRLNDIPNIDEFILKMITQGFTVERYGAAPTARERIVEKVVEKIVEVPVDKIVEKIVEVTVEKEVYITDDSHTKKLTDEIERLQKLKEINDLDQANSHEEMLGWIEKVKNLEKELQEEKNKKRDIYGE